MTRRNDIILLITFACSVAAIVLVSFAPPLPSSYSIVQRIWDWANTNFVTAFAGAFAGAIGAQFIFERTSKRKALRTEIKEVNAAISIAADVTNNYLVFKKQIVHPVCEAYEQALRARINHAINPVSQFHMTIDSRLFVAPFSPVEALQRSLQERLIPEGPALSFLTLLVQAIRALDETLVVRNQLIERLRLAPIGSVDLDAVYFGAPVGAITDGSYTAYMQEIRQLTDDCIGIGIVLGSLLHDYGKKIAKMLGGDAPKIAKIEWDTPEAVDLVPDLSRYKGWLIKSFRMKLD